jgi:hypothetical protein
MNRELSDLVWELREAIDEGLWKSSRVTAAIVALEQAGQHVQMAVDAALMPKKIPMETFC